MPDLEQLARAEHAAEVARSKHDTRWRSAWWDLTLALGQLPKAGSGERAKVVAEIVGQAHSSILNRRQLGIRVFMLEIENVHTLPPRMLLAIPASQFSSETVDLARQAARRGDSLREFSAALTGKAWADDPVGMSEQTIEKIAEAQPEIVAKTVARVNPVATRQAVEAEEDEQRDLAVIARGGRVRSLEEINKNVGERAIDGVIDRLATYDEGLSLITAGGAKLASLGQLSIAEQQGVRDAAVALLDLFLDDDIQRIDA